MPCYPPFTRSGPVCAGLTLPQRRPGPALIHIRHQKISGGARWAGYGGARGGFAPDDPQLEEVWGLLAEARVPVVVHAGHAPIGTENTGPGPFGALMKRFPDLTAIVAHLGAPDYGAFLRMAASYERVALDTTMVFTGFFDKLAPFPAGDAPLARELGMAGKILLGSDFPNLPYPYARQLAGLAGIGFGDDWLRKVCWDNPVAMFGLPETVS